MTQTQPTDPVRLLQISDCHLLADRQQTLLGVNTEETLSWVLDLASESLPVDLLMLTGDLAQDASEQAYRRLYQHIQRFETPSAWLCGNHDNRAVMRAALAGKADCLARRVVMGNWQILMLHSPLSGAVQGRLEPAELAFIQQWVVAFSGHTLLCMHHNPVDVGTRWMSDMGLENEAEFWQLLADLPAVKGVLCGHVHQEYDSVYQGVRVLASPSSCFQFEPYSDDFTVGSQQPGLRLLQLYPDGRIETQVRRLKDQRLVVSNDYAGY